MVGYSKKKNACQFLWYGFPNTNRDIEGYLRYNGGYRRFVVQGKLLVLNFTDKKSKGYIEKMRHRLRRGTEKLKGTDMDTDTDFFFWVFEIL